MAYNDPQLLHLDTMLSGISAGFDNPIEYLTPNLAPAVNVAKQSDKYYVLNRDTWGRQTPDLRAPGATANELPPMTLSRDSYFAQEHALKDVVPTEDTEAADAGLSPLADSSERLTNTILLNRELALTDFVTDASNYNNSFTDSPSTKWDNSGTPIADFRAAYDAIFSFLFRPPNVVVMGRVVYRALEVHDDFIERIKTGLAVPTTQIIQQVLGFDQGKFIVANGGKLTSAVNETPETTDFMWGDDVLLAYVPPNPGRKQPAFMYEFNQAIAGNTMPNERWYDQDRVAEILRVRRRYDLKPITIDSDGLIIGAGFLLKDVLQ